VLYLRALASMAPDVASASSVLLASVSDITRCLKVQGRQVVVQDCVDGGGLLWSGSSESLTTPGKLRMAALSSQDTAESSRTLQASMDECLHTSGGQFLLWPCAQSVGMWHWDPETLQLRAGAGQCLAAGAAEGRLSLAPCRYDEATGVPPEQAWVVLPARQPQVELLSRLRPPLRASGRFVGDASGLRIKLAGVSIKDTGTDPQRLMQVIKYLGFNSVRLSYGANSEMGPLDAAVEAASQENLLVVLSRENDAVSLVDEVARQQWLGALSFMAEHYKDHPRVVAMDLLDGVALDEEAQAMPWWGVPEVYEAIASAMDFRLIDWRTAAAEGANAVWAGNPNLLVVVQGGLYGTDLANVANRPLNLAQECLRSRLVYETQERAWLSKIYALYEQRARWLAPFNLYSGIEDVVAERRQHETQQPQASSQFLKSVEQQEAFSYEQYSDARQEAAFYLSTEGTAPVWVSNLGVSSRTGNTWWNYTVASLAQSDASWFYSPLGVGNDMEDGIFDASSQAPFAVVGWKLQALVALQAPDARWPSQLPVPGTCQYESASNLAVAKERLGLVDALATTPWSLDALVALAMPLLLLVLCFLCCCRRRREDSHPLGPNADLFVPGGAQSLDDAHQIRSEATKGSRSLWCCTCSRELPINVPPMVAQILPAGATVPTGYTSLEQRYVRDMSMVAGYERE